MNALKVYSTAEMSCQWTNVILGGTAPSKEKGIGKGMISKGKESFERWVKVVKQSL